MFLVVSYTTVPPLPVLRTPQSDGKLHSLFRLLCGGPEKHVGLAIGGPFLWHYPSARADWTLSSILPFGARTFLPQLALPAIVCQTFRFAASSITRITQ